MKAYRGAFLSVCVAAGMVVLAGCGNALDGGSDPSGSIIRVVTVSPDPPEAFTPDIFVTICDVDEETGEITYEPGIFNSYANITLLNDKRPNTPTGEDGNTHVTMSRYRVDFTGLNKTVQIPSIDGGGISVGIAPGATGVMRVLLMDFPTLDYISSHYGTIGHTESLTLRATVTVWGEDAFGARVSETVDVTLVVSEYDRC